MSEPEGRANHEHGLSLPRSGSASRRVALMNRGTAL
jgi:hypothetical protein